MRKFEKIRTAIKKLSDAQIALKPQRKESYKGVRTSNNPSWDREKNKYELRHLFQAYAILKGVERPKVTKKEMSESKVQELVKQYEVTQN